MACPYSSHDIINYLDKELTYPEQKSFEQHLSSCQRCQNSIDLLQQVEVNSKQLYKPNPYIAEKTMNHIRAGKSRSDLGLWVRLNRILHPKIMASSFIAALSIMLLIAFWKPITAGISSLIEQKYSDSLQQKNLQSHQEVPANDTTPEPTPVSQPAILPPSQTPGNEGTPDFAIYKASVSLKNLYNSYSDGSPEETDYEDIRIHEIPLEEEPLLTEDNIETYYKDTLIFRGTSIDTYDAVMNRCISAGPIPIVITLDGKRVAWGTFMHPISSMRPPLDAFHLSLHLRNDQNDNAPYFKLSVNDSNRFTDLNQMIQSAFSYNNKLSEKASVPENVLKINPFGIGGDHGSETNIYDRFSSPEYLSEIEFTNLNSETNETVYIGLPQRWKAKETVHETVPPFKFLNPKNEKVKLLKSFTLYAEDYIDDTWYYEGKGILSGALEIRGYNRELPESAKFSNHAIIAKKLYEGDTRLGIATIFLLDCDLPDMVKTVNETSYQMVTAWIPIDGENLAYCLELPVPNNEMYEKFLDFALVILK